MRDYAVTLLRPFLPHRFFEGLHFPLLNPLQKGLRTPAGWYAKPGDLFAGMGFISYVVNRFQGTQSIGLLPCCNNILLICENGLLPKKPLCAERGEGCGARRIKCRLGSTAAAFACAGEPQRTKIIPCFSRLTVSMTASVNCSQPLFA